MQSKVQDRNRVIRLRKQGKSYREIQQLVPVSKGTLSKWCRTIPLTKKEAQFLRDRTRILQDKGRMKIAAQKHALSDQQRDRVRVKAKVDFNRYKDDPLFTLGVALYWAHGAKRGSYFNFVSSDVAMMRIMLRWAEHFLPVEPTEYRFRLHLDQATDERTFVRWWSRECALPTSQFTSPGVQPCVRKRQKSVDYKGSLRFMISGSAWVLIMQTWQTELSLYHVGAQ